MPRATDLTERTVLIILALGIGALEQFIPRIPIFPWLKPGLANAITLVWLIRYGATEAFLFSILRVWVLATVFGFSLPTVFLASTGAATAILVESFVYYTFVKISILGCVSMGVLGAFTHNVTQLAGVQLFISHSSALWMQLPVMGIAAIVFGTLTASLVMPVLRICNTYRAQSDSITLANNSTDSPSLISYFMSLLFIGYIFTIALTENHATLSIFCLISFFGAGICKKKITAGLLFLPLRRFYPFFLFAALLPLFARYGIRPIASIPVTYEGLGEAAQQVLRLYAWIQISHCIPAFKIDRIFLWASSRLYPPSTTTITAATHAVTHFSTLLPTLFNEAKEIIRLHKKRLILHPVATLSMYLENLYRSILAHIEKNSQVHVDNN